MQRLTRIKQLGHTYIVYPSAAHSRFGHSIGVLNVAGRICNQIRLPKRDRKIVRISALLHDVGHGPFSHVFEKVIEEIIGDKISHEYIDKLIIENNSELKRILTARERKELLNLLNEQETARSEIISSSLDADKMDYLRRDSYHTGVAYGYFDFERVIRNICVIEDDARQYLGIDEKGKDAIESYRLARYLMYRQVYEHHTRLIADDMFLRAMKFALDEGVLKEQKLNPLNDVDKFLKYYLALDDYSIQHQILNKSTKKAKKILSNLRNRKLLKRAFVTPLSAQAIPDYRRRRRLVRIKKDEISSLEQEIASEASVSSEDVIVHPQSTEIKLYERFEETLGRKERPILIRHYDGSIGSLDEESPFSASIIPIRILYVFCPKKDVQKVGEITEAKIDVKNYYTPKTYP